jgi:hypothetical protein
MKKSKLNFERQDLVTTFDEYGMCVGPYGSGKEDSIGRTFMAFIAYNKFRIGHGIYLCFKSSQLYRHPNYDNNTISRDHVFYYFMYYYEAVGSDYVFMQHEINSLPRPFKKISNMKNSNMLPDLWSFIRALNYKHKAWYRFLYYTWNLHMVFTFTWDKMCLKFGWHKLLGFRVYALHILAWQLHYLRKQKDSLINRFFTRLVLWYNEPTNYAIRLICGDKTVRKEDVENYEGTVTNRWTCDPKRTKRDMSKRIGDDVKYNNLDRDYLIALWERVMV